METLAAYGGSVAPTVYRVTNLNDSGAGSFRRALEASGPRVVIFEISGAIRLSAPIYVNSPYLTIAGQTAPAPGITIQSYAIYVTTHDVLLQHLRIRHGADTCGSAFEAWGADAFNIVLDHISASWGQDETIYISNPRVPAMNVTVWRSIISEGLNGAMNGGCSEGSPNGSYQSHGLLVYDGTKFVSILQSLFAHNLERNPYASGDTTTYIANNVVYDFDNASATQVIDNEYRAGGRLLSTVVGNYYRRGPSTDFYVSAVGARYLSPSSRLYLSDNALDGGLIPIWDFFLIGDDGADPRVGSPPVSVSGYTPMSSGAAYSLVLSKAGARPNQRDAVDTRTVGEVQTRTGHFLSNPAEVGGFPSLAVNARPLDLPANPHALAQSGYTVLEEWLHDFAAFVEDGTNAAPVPPPPPAPDPLPAPVPDPAPSPTSPSPNGLRVPAASMIIDNVLAAWTIGPAGEILRNGVHMVGGYGSQILWSQGWIYVVGEDGNWWRWTGVTWAFYGPPWSL